MLDEIIAFVVGALNATVDIPLISGLYKLIAGGSELSVLDGFSLLLAIPVTILYKVVTGEAPFANGTHGLDTMSWQQMQAALGRTPNSLQLAASRAEAGAEDDPVMKLYSVVGGLVSLIAQECNALLFPFATVAEKAGDERLAAVLCVIRASLNGLGLGGSVPFDNATVEERIDRVMWTLEGIETFTFGTLAGWECTRLAKRDFWDPAAMEAAKGYSKVLGRVDAGMCLAIGVLGAICDTYSFYLEGETTEDKLSNPVFAWYYEKLFSNYFGDVGMAAEGAASFMKDEAFKIPTEAVAGVFYPLGFVLNFSRLIAFAVGDLYYQTR